MSRPQQLVSRIVLQDDLAQYQTQILSTNIHTTMLKGLGNIPNIANTSLSTVTKNMSCCFQENEAHSLFTFPYVGHHAIICSH